MRQCPRCQTPHSDDAGVCRVDGTPLTTGTRSRVTPAAPQPMGSEVFPPGPDVDDDPQASATGSLQAHGSNPNAATAAMRPAGASRRQQAIRIDERAEDAVGRILGSYKLLEVIGRGGMGRVYLAEHIRLGRHVALKLLRPEYAVKRDAVARFFQEAKAVNKIRHRNIVDVTDFVELEDGTTFIIMELLEGASLGKQLRTQGPMEEPRLLSILVQVCDALEAAHAVGIVHRDLKPDNIFLVHDPAGGELVKLLDFGVAKLLATQAEPDEGGWQTAAGSVVGTPAYMSPEQAGGLEIDGRSDVYSLGAIMYELFCGEPLFKARSFGEFVMKHINELPVPPRQTRNGAAVSLPLERIILRCVAKKPEERYANVAVLRDDLLGMLGAYDTGLVDLRRQRDPARSSGLRTPSGAHGPPTPHSPSSPQHRSGARSRPGEGAPLPAPGTSGSVASPSAAALAGTPLGASILGDEAPVAARTPLPAAPETALAVGDLQAVRPRRRGGWAVVILGGAAVLAVAGWVAATRLGPDPDRATPSRPAERPAVTPAPIGPAATANPPAANPPAAAARIVTVAFQSDPAGATVYLLGSDESICDTPCDVRVDRDDGAATDKRVYVLRRAGYQATTYEAPLTEGERHEAWVILLEEGAPPRPRSDKRPGTDPPPTTAPPPVTPPDPPPKRPDQIDPADTMDPWDKAP